MVSGCVSLVHPNPDGNTGPGDSTLTPFFQAVLLHGQRRGHGAPEVLLYDPQPLTTTPHQSPPCIPFLVLGFVACHGANRKHVPQPPMYSSSSPRILALHYEQVSFICEHPFVMLVGTPRGRGYAGADSDFGAHPGSSNTPNLAHQDRDADHLRGRTCSALNNNPKSGFDGCLVNLKGKELEIQTAELMGGSVPRATYKFVAEGPGQNQTWVSEERPGNLSCRFLNSILETWIVGERARSLDLGAAGLRRCRERFPAGRSKTARTRWMWGWQCLLCGGELLGRHRLLTRLCRGTSLIRKRSPP